MDKTDKVYVDIVTNVEKSNQGLTEYIGKLGIAFFSVQTLNKIIKAGIDLMKDSVREYMEAEKAVTQLSAAFKAQGQYTKETIDDLSDYAKSLQLTTTFSDEASMSAEAMLKQLTHLNIDGIKQLLPLVQDFATAMGMDLTSAASLVAKTIGSETNALARYGVAVKADATETEKLREVTNKLTMQFGGMAAEIGNTTTGKIQILKSQISELKETFGGMILMKFEPLITSILNQARAWDQVARDARAAGVSVDDYIRKIENIPTIATKQGLVPAAPPKEALNIPRLVPGGDIKLPGGSVLKIPTVLDEATIKKLEAEAAAAQAIDDAILKSLASPMTGRPKASDYMYGRTKPTVTSPKDMTNVQDLARYKNAFAGFDVTVTPTINVDPSVEALQRLGTEMQRVFSMETLGAGLVDVFYEIGRSANMGAKGVENMTVYMENLAAGVLKNLGALLISSGLSAMGNPATFGLGVGMVGAGIVAGVAGGALSQQAANTTNVTNTTVVQGNVWTEDSLIAAGYKKTAGW